jgi:hypothetical protein
VGNHRLEINHNIPLFSPFRTAAVARRTKLLARLAEGPAEINDAARRLLKGIGPVADLVPLQPHEATPETSEHPALLHEPALHSPGKQKKGRKRKGRKKGKEKRKDGERKKGWKEEGKAIETFRESRFSRIESA